MTEPLDHHAALIYAMVTMSAVDRTMTDAELARIGEIVSNLPVFADFDQERLVKTAEACGEVLSEDGGLDRVLVLDQERAAEEAARDGLRHRARGRRRRLDVKPEEIALPRHAEREPRARQAHHGGDRARHQSAQYGSVGTVEREGLPGRFAL